MRAMPSITGVAREFPRMPIPPFCPWFHAAQFKPWQHVGLNVAALDCLWSASGKRGLSHVIGADPPPEKIIPSRLERPPPMTPASLSAAFAVGFMLMSMLSGAITLRTQHEMLRAVTLMALVFAFMMAIKAIRLLGVELGL